MYESLLHGHIVTEMSKRCQPQFSNPDLSTLHVMFKVNSSIMVIKEKQSEGLDSASGLGS